MAEWIFTPVSAEASNRRIDMADAQGNLLRLDMPNAAGAAFIAIAIQNELTAAKRGSGT